MEKKIARTGGQTQIDSESANQTGPKQTGLGYIRTYVRTFLRGGLYKSVRPSVRTYVRTSVRASAPPLQLGSRCENIA